ncbi:mRNA (guanine-N(7))-methyltransferase domain, partial [Trinorchestia longiramus]
METPENTKEKEQKEKESSQESKEVIKDKIAAHYNAVRQMTIAERKNSKIIKIRTFHNFIKTMLLTEHPGLSVLDLCCGKGGDIGKFSKMGTKTYVGVDIADKSLECARERAEKTKMNFQIMHADAFNTKLR